AEVVLFDQPVVAPHARALSGEGFDVLTGDYLLDDLGGPYDIVFLSNIVHGESPERAERLLARVADALTPGGTVVVRDRFVHDDRTGPDWATDFGITLVLYTDEGHTRTRGEARALLERSGFVEVVHHALDGEE